MGGRVPDFRYSEALLDKDRETVLRVLSSKSEGHLPNVYELEGADGENLGRCYVNGLKKAKGERLDDESMAEMESSGKIGEVESGESDEFSE